jgi:co-chaperonin GroES (HSP10)
VKTLRPLKGKIFVSELDDGMHKTAGGIIIIDDKVTDRGIRPRWAKVALIADDVTDVKVGEWVLIEHGRWTLRTPVGIDGVEVDVWMIDPAAILVVSDENHSHERFTL